MRHSRPRVVVSECLGFNPTRHDGSMAYDETVASLRKFADMIPVCPEVGMGLGVPRNPLVMTKDGEALRLIDAKTGEVLSDRMEAFARSFVSGLVDVDGFIMKSKSPSCGIGDAKVYGKGGAVLSRSDGAFAKLLREAFPLLPIESEKRLLKYEIRRTFFTKLFALADLRETLPGAGPDELVELHRRNKYILMLHSPRLLKRLGRMVAERSSRGLQELKDDYRRTFLEALSKSPGRGSYANAFVHIYSHVKGCLSAEERGYVLSLIEEYRAGRCPLKTLVVYFKGFVYRSGSGYLAEQRFIEPYPTELDYVMEGE